MVYLVLANGEHSYADGFRLAAIVDATIVLYTVAYFATFGFELPGKETPTTRLQI